MVYVIKYESSGTTGEVLTTGDSAEEAADQWQEYVESSGCDCKILNVREEV